MSKLIKTKVENNKILYRCYSCKDFKNIEWFYEGTNHFKKEQYQCRLCKRESAMKSYFKNDVNRKMTAKRREWTEEDKILNNERQKFYYWNRIKKRLLYLAKERSKKYNIPFNITSKDIILPELCPYLNVPFQKGTKDYKWYTYSIDKIIPELGYVKGNIQVITYLANTMKNKATKEELINFAKNILKFMT
jgi:hypothetical protein